MDVGSLVHDRPDLGEFRVHRFGLVSPEIHELERRRIFDRCWLYLGHESEVAEPGDYARRVVAERPLFFARDRDGRLVVSPEHRTSSSTNGGCRPARSLAQPRPELTVVAELSVARGACGAW